MAESKGPEFVDEVGKMINDFMSLRGHPDADSSALSAAVINWIRENYKGEQIYIKTRQDRTRHAAAIKAEFDGNNLAEIMERYQVSRATVYRIAGD